MLNPVHTRTIPFWLATVATVAQTPSRCRVGGHSAPQLTQSAEHSYNVNQDQYLAPVYMWARTYVVRGPSVSTKALSKQLRWPYWRAGRLPRCTHVRTVTTFFNTASVHSNVTASSPHSIFAAKMNQLPYLVVTNVTTHLATPQPTPHARLHSYLPAGSVKA